MLIRKMTIDDYAEVYDLWLSCAGMGLNTLDDSREGIARFLERNPETCFVAEDGGIRGVIMAGNDGRRGYIYHTAVQPECRARGVGTQLVGAAMQALAQLGINKVALVAFEHNEVGNRFWESRGFGAREDLVYRDKAIREMAVNINYE